MQVKMYVGAYISFFLINTLLTLDNGKWNEIKMLFFIYWSVLQS